MTDVLNLLTAFGLGSLISVVAQSYFGMRSETRRTVFQERKEAYIGLLESWRDQDIEGINKKNRYEVGHWMLRCQLVASKELKDQIELWTQFEPGSDQRIGVTQKVKELMRRDLLGYKLQSK